MKVFVTLTFTDDAGNVLKMFRGKSEPLKCGSQMQAVESSLWDAASKQSIDLDIGRQVIALAQGHHD